MSNQNPDTKYRDSIESLEFILNQFRKSIYTSIPATIESYDATSKRAKVLPAINRLFTDNTNAPLPPLTNVPVIFPSGGGFTMHFPIVSGDVVMLIFSMRGIQNFKQDYQRSNPTNENILDYDSPVAIAGFGKISFTPADSSSSSLQTDNGENAIILGNSQAQLKIGVATLILNESGLTSNAPFSAPDFTSTEEGEQANFSTGIKTTGNITTTENVTAGTISLKTHVHSGVQTGGGDTGVPIP